MKYTLIIMWLFVGLLCLSSCKKEKESKTIVTKIEAPKISTEPRAMRNEDTIHHFRLDGAQFTAQIQRRSSEELPMIKDEYGQKYYDNTVTLTVLDSHGAVLSRSFTKNDFEKYVSTSYIKPSQSALLGISFKEVKNNRAEFIASVGSPDPLDDLYMLVGLSVSKSGTIEFKTIDALEDEEDF